MLFVEMMFFDSSKPETSLTQHNISNKKGWKL